MFRVIKLLTMINLLFCLASCAFQGREDLSGFIDAASRAEEYMRRNGFTPSGHPPDLPVNVVENLDKYLLSNETDRENLLKMRKGRIRGPAYCVSQKQDGNYVSFSQPEDDCQIVVKVIENSSFKLMHGCTSLTFLDPCHRLKN